MREPPHFMIVIKKNITVTAIPIAIANLVEVGWSLNTLILMGAARASRLALCMVSFASMLGVVMAVAVGARCSMRRSMRVWV